MPLTLKDLPEYVNIGPYNIKFRTDPDLWLREDKWAAAHFRYAEIVLAENIPPDRILAKAIVHEVLHHIVNIYGAKDCKEDEKFIERLDKGILDFLVHNKELVIMLMEA